MVAPAVGATGGAVVGRLVRLRWRERPARPVVIPPTALTFHLPLVTRRVTGTSRTTELDPVVVEVRTSVRTSRLARVGVSDSTTKPTTRAVDENCSAARAAPAPAWEGDESWAASPGVVRSTT